MYNLNHYLLNACKVLPYLQENLEGTNAVSTAILKYVNFEQGEFYTLFQEKVKENQLYEFAFGGVGGSIKDKISYIVLEELQTQSELTCVFDDTGATYEAPYNDPLFIKIGMHYQEEVYYVVSAKNASKELLDTCFYASESNWHSLCVLSEVSFFRREDRSLTEKEVISIAEGARFIIMGAYDAESFVFWRKAVS